MNTQAALPTPHGPRKGILQNALREIAFSIFVRKTVVVTVFIVVFVFAFLMAVLLPPIYRATSKFSMTIPVTFDPLEVQTAYDYKNKYHRELQSQKELIMSNRVLMKVFKTFSLDKGVNIAKAIDRIKEDLEVVPPKGETFENTTFFYLNYEAGNPKDAARFAQSITEAYLETYGELAQEKAEYSHSFFKQQTQELYKKLQEKEAAFRDYEKKKAVQLIDILNLDPTAASNMEVGPTALLTRFQGKYLELQEELASVRMSVESISKAREKRGDIPIVMPEMEEAGRAITVFKRKVAQLQIQLNEMKPRFQEGYELLRQTNQELNLNIQSLQNELTRSLKANEIKAQSIETRLKAIERTMDDLKKRITETAQERSIYEQLKQEYNIAKNAYVLASTQLEQARLAQALNKEKQHITLVDKPVVPDKPVKPNRPLIVLLGFIAGAFLGIGMALSIDFFDHSIRKNEDIEYHLDTTVLGSIPQLT
ncbi:MAG: GNVR domain-containing protein [Pseudomonadota bacterium]